MNVCGWRAVAPALVLVLAAGCSKGSIKLEDQDKFGAVRSAVWFEWNQDTDDGDYQSHSFLMANRSGVCKTMQEAMPEIAEGYEDLISAFYANNSYSSSSGYYDTGGNYTGGGGGGGGGGDLCNAYKTYIETIATVLDPMFGKGVNTLTFTLRDPDDDSDDEPPDDDYEAGYDQDDPYFSGALSYYDENPYQVILDDMDCGGDQSDWYYAIEDAFDDIDIFTIDDGDLTAEQNGKGNAYKIKMDGDLEDDDGDNAGDLAFKAKFTHCEVEWDGYAYLGIGLGGGGSYGSYSSYSSYDSSSSSYYR